MGRGSAVRLVLTVLAACVAGCDEAPLETREPAGPASPEVVTAPVSPETPSDEHPYLTAYREEMRLVLRPEQGARLRAVDAGGTDSLDVRRLAFVAADRVLRSLLPLLLDAAGMRAEARRLRDLAAIEDDAGTRAAQRHLSRVVARVEQQLRHEVEEPPFPGRRALRAARLAEEIAAPLAGDGADREPRPEDARRVTAVFELVFEAYLRPEELAVVEPLAVQLFADLVALGRGGEEPPE
jgi:hypothetical protein